MPVRTVFLSSTAKDLHEYREAAYRAIEDMRGWHCIWMESFGAIDGAPDEFCQKMVAECNLFVGIVGHCYGSCPKGSKKSYTEHEYDAAVATDKPRLMFFAPEDFPVPADQIESYEKMRKQRTFRKRISEERIHAKFSSPEVLAKRIVVAVRNWEMKHMQHELLREGEMKGRKQERDRIRDEIHDTVFGALARLMLTTDDALMAASTQMRSVLTEVRPRITEIIEELEIALGSRTREDEDREKETRTTLFIHKLEKICAACEKAYKLKIHRDFRRDVVKLIPPIFLQILRRILDLQLRNVWEHGEATEVRITLEPDRLFGKRPHRIKFIVYDNGKGCDFSWESLDPDQRGLLGSRERVEEAGGSLEVYSALSEGFTLTVTIPLVVDIEDATA